MSALTLEVLKEVLYYDPETGKFIRRKRSRGPKSSVGAVAGGENHRGYVWIMLDGKRYAAHRLAWFYMTGRWPERDIDHKNRRKNDNRFSNLREATRTENVWNTPVRANNRVGLKGVHFDKSSNRWKAQINIAGKKRHLGLFPTAELGAEFYDLAAKMVRGEFH